MATPPFSSGSASCWTTRPAAAWPISPRLIDALTKAQLTNQGATITLATATATYDADLAKHGATSATTVAAYAAMAKAQLTMKSSTIGLTTAQANLKASEDASTVGIATLEAHFKGTAATAADTASGKLKTLDATVMNFAEDTGQKLIPKVESLVKHLASFGEWVLDHKPVLIAFAAVIGTLLAGAVAIYIDQQVRLYAMKAKSLIQWAASTLHLHEEAAAIQETVAPQAEMNDLLAALQDILVQLGGSLPEVSAGIDDLAGSTDVLDTSLEGTEAAGAPIIGTVGLIAAVVALLVIGILELVKHWSVVWAEVKRIVEPVWKWLDGVFQDIAHVAIAVWDGFLNFFKDLWKDVEDVFTGAFDWLKENWETVVQIIISLIVPGGIFVAAFWRWHDQILPVGIRRHHPDRQLLRGPPRECDQRSGRLRFPDRDILREESGHPRRREGGRGSQLLREASRPDR